LLSDLAKNIPVQEGHILAADVANAGFELEGDIDALKLIDLGILFYILKDFFFFLFNNKLNV
jgi:hypothetical protein